MQVLMWSNEYIACWGRCREFHQLLMQYWWKFMHHQSLLHSMFNLSSWYLYDTHDIRSWFVSSQHDNLPTVMIILLVITWHFTIVPLVLYIQVHSYFGKLFHNLHAFDNSENNKTGRLTFVCFLNEGLLRSFGYFLLLAWTSRTNLSGGIMILFAKFSLTEHIL